MLAVADRKRLKKDFSDLGQRLSSLRKKRTKEDADEAEDTEIEKTTIVTKKKKQVVLTENEEVKETPTAMKKKPVVKSVV